MRLTIETGQSQAARGKALHPPSAQRAGGREIPHLHVRPIMTAAFP